MIAGSRRYLPNITALLILPLLCFLFACGSSSSDVNLGGGAGSSDGSSSGGGSSLSGSNVWDVRAAVSGDSCGERISDVRQSFAVNSSSGTVSVNSSAITLQGTSTSDGFTASMQESNGKCTRTYTTDFTNMSDNTADVELTAHSDCGANSCESHWTGTATKR